MSVIIDGHVAVSNELESDATDVVGAPVEDAPSAGSEPGASGQASGEVESVESYTRLETIASEEWELPSTELRDIAEASFGPPPPLAEIVHGPDDRVQINNTHEHPWRMHASLLITAADNSQWIGTGWFVGPHTLITAGHVVYIKNSGVPGRDGWVKSITVMAGRNGTSLSYGAVSSQSFRSVKGWTESGSEEYDYGAIILPNDNVGNQTGWFGYGVYTDDDLRATTANLSGYPGDKPTGTQWYASRRIDSVNPRKVYYDIDTAGGQSGSAVYRIKSGGNGDTQRFAVAIHAYGGATTNSGTRINSAVFDNIKAWKA
jgi:glutamyl endopeptidase